MTDAVTGFRENNVVREQRMFLYASQLRQSVAGCYAKVTLVTKDQRGRSVITDFEKTEVVKNTSSPKWTEHFDFDYELGCTTMINVGLFSPKAKPIATVCFDVEEIFIHCNTQGKTIRQGGRELGTLFCRITSAPVEQSGVLTLQLAGLQLKNLESMFGKSNPFFEVHAKVTLVRGPKWQLVYRSKTLMKDLNPVWEPCQIDLSKLCPGITGDDLMTRPILVCVWHRPKNGENLTLGQFEILIDDLLSASLDSPVTSEGNDGNGINSSLPAATMFDTSRSFDLQKDGKSYGMVVVAQAKIEGVGASGPCLGRPTPQESHANVPSDASTASSVSADTAPEPRENGVAPSSSAPERSSTNEPRQNENSPSSSAPRRSDTHQQNDHASSSSSPTRCAGNDLVSDFAPNLLPFDQNLPAAPVREVSQPPQQSPLSPWTPNAVNAFSPSSSNPHGKADPPSASTAGLTSHAPPQSVDSSGKIFYVEVPAEASGGQQLEVQCPFTNQRIIVEIPQDLKPGGKFGVCV